MEAVLRIVVFQVGTGYFGIDIRKIQEIVKDIYQTEATDGNSSNIIGLLNIQENVVPILNLHKKFQTKPLLTEHMYFIIVNIENKLLALPSDGIGQYYDVPFQFLNSLPYLMQTMSTQYIQYIAKIGGMLVPLLNLEWLYREMEINIPGNKDGSTLAVALKR